MRRHPGVSRRKLPYIHHQNESVRMEIDAEGEQQVGVEYLFLSTANEIGCPCVGSLPTHKEK
jgi:hypothetical protein